ncbi:hypothetical protein NDU88_002825 [Pleurodeles waltl]|uniref:Uncharacterized protein n=1 Tax=Pleurodeles waltl TaxID=8319 RepID=A0AAV7VDZ0_PLEWA|nr:hypothetical protein NDU88_002825 [Pleurodeles waltl]
MVIPKTKKDMYVGPSATSKLSDSEIPLKEHDITQRTLEGPQLQDILQAITSLGTLEAKIDLLGAELGLIKDDHRRLAERVTTAEPTLQDIPLDLRETQEQFTSMEGKV